MSIIVIKDQESKDKIAEYAGNQKHISQSPVFLLFVADFHRSKLACEKNGEDLIITDNMEGTLVGSIDVGIAIGSTIAAAESLGFGITCIGGVRKNPDKIIELLKLPDYVYPMVGMCIGYPDIENIPGKKPRLNKNAVVHKETYNPDLSSYIDEFDKIIEDYMASRPGTSKVHDWSSTIAKMYKKVYYPKVSQTLRDQKFKCE